MTPGEFIQQIAPLAVTIGQRYKVPPSILIAQAFNESRYGNSGLATKANNLTGMKATGKAIPGIWDGAKKDFKTGEQTKAGQKYEILAPFRQYADWGQSLEDLAHRHAVRFKITKDKFPDTGDFLKAVVDSGYGTDVNYLPSTKKVIDAYGLQKFDKINLVKPGKADGEKKKNFLQRHKKPLIIGAGLLTLSGVLYATTRK